MTISAGLYFGAELAERAQGARDLSDLRRGILDRLQMLVGCETAFWGEYHGTKVTPEASVWFAPHNSGRRALERFAAARARYDAPQGLRALQKCGVAVDTEIFTPEERDRLPLYAEVLRRAGIRTYLACGIAFRGGALSFMTLGRHAGSARYSDREQTLLRQIRGSVGLVEAAFRFAMDPCMADRLRAAYQLTGRESQVADMVVRGLQNKEIAALLGTSPETVRKQTIRIYEKARVSGRMQLLVRVGATFRPEGPPAPNRGYA
jgi:DNA-binding CsgD family transcriptional regulator